MQHRNRWMIVIVIFAAIQLAACGQSSGGAEKIEPAQVTPIEGTELNRLVLVEEAAKRLDIQTAPVGEEPIARTRTIGGEVVTPGGSEAQAAADASEYLVQVVLSEGDLNQVDLSQPAAILPLVRVEGESGAPAQPVEAPAVGEEQEIAEALYYVVEGAEPELEPGQRVRVELTLAGSGTTRMVVPYAAVIYDLNGDTWVYTNPEPLTYVRHPITIDYIEGDLAILVDGPPAGTEVVTAGAAELFGEEFGIGH